MNQAFIVCCKETTTNRDQEEELFGPRNKEWTLDRWKSVLWSDESKFEIFGSNHRVFVRHSEGEQMVSTCVVWCDGNTVGDLFRIQGTFNQQHAIPSGLCLSFVIQQDNEPKHGSVRTI